MIKGSLKRNNIPSLYVEILISNDMMNVAKKRADGIPETIKNSILKGKGRITGALGEIAFIKFSGGRESRNREVYNFDVVTDTGLYEIKTKLRSGCPKEYYECSVANFNSSQECDYYVFASTIHNYSKVWLLGYLSKEDFKKKRIFRKKGEYDPDNGQTCTADCWNVKINQLNNIREIL